MKLQFATNTTAKTTEAQIDGKTYLVSPVVAIRQGVLNGVLVPMSEIENSVEAWAGRAVPIRHPKANGQYISANSPQVWASDVVGFLYNVGVDGDRLVGEIWVDLERAEKIGERALSVVNRLRANEPIEVSTGYFADLEETSGFWNGVAYSGIARNIRPDHLALLPDEIGACSWKDGCGTPRVNTKGETMDVNEIELEDRIELVRRAFWQQIGRAADLDLGPDVWPVAIFENTVIAKDWAGKGHFAYSYTINEEAAVTFGEPTPVEVVYRSKEGGAEVVVANTETPSASERTLFGKFLHWFRQDKVEGISVQQEDTVMKKCDLVSALTANARCKFSKETLEKWSEADLQMLYDSLSVNEEASAQAEQPVAQPAVVQLPAEITQFAEMIQGLGGVTKLAEALGSITANANRERDAIVADIMANERNPFSEAELKTMPADQLRKLGSALLQRNYSGAAGVIPNRREDEDGWEELPLPVFTPTQSA